MTKFRYRKNLGEKWRKITNWQDFMQMLNLAHPTDCYEIRKDCDHTNTFNDGGILICKNCQEHLAVTSFRD